MLSPQQTAQCLERLDSLLVLSIYKWICKPISAHHFLTSVTVPCPHFKYIPASLLDPSAPPIIGLFLPCIFWHISQANGMRWLLPALTTSSHCNLAPHHEGTETTLQAAISAFCYQTLHHVPSPCTWRTLTTPLTPLKSPLLSPFRNSFPCLWFPQTVYAVLSSLDYWQFHCRFWASDSRLCPSDFSCSLDPQIYILYCSCILWSKLKVSASFQCDFSS